MQYITTYTVGMYL